MSEHHSETEDSAVMVEHDSDSIPDLDPDDGDALARPKQPSDKAVSSSVTASPRNTTIVSKSPAGKGMNKDPASANDNDDDDDDTPETLGPYASQIVSIDESTGTFAYHPKRVAKILHRIPPQYKISVVSVVGAFRTGKSFLLSWFLRYLHAMKQQQEEEQKKSSDSNEKGEAETNKNDSPWYKQFDSLGNDGFDWRGGSERNTTGIWMWSHPHILSTKDSSQPLAVLLVDTQGMFDNETTMKLATSIFGFSTLLSSYQIYNVDKLIKEDNLQQLALFSEYARSAVTTEEKSSKKHLSDGGGKDSPANKKPFQHIEFLVRDYQHWDDEDAELEVLEKSMNEYLDKVISAREAKDLKETREQIHSCFQQISCYGLCHPGAAVTRKKFTGDVGAIEELFLRLLDRYCQRVFGSLEPKVIHGRQLTAMELSAYIEAYADIFTSGTSFPTAATMLEATASANNTNAIHLAVEKYKEIMDHVAGANCSMYHKPEELEEEHIRALDHSLEVFAEIANFGNETSIDEARKMLLTQNKASFRIYQSLNESRNPLAGLETFIVPAFIAIISWISRWFVDLTCSPYSAVCKAGSEALHHTWWVVFFFLVLVGATKYRQLKDSFARFYKVIDMMMKDGDSSKPKKD